MDMNQQFWLTLIIYIFLILYRVGKCVKKWKLFFRWDISYMHPKFHSSPRGKMLTKEIKMDSQKDKKVLGIRIWGPFAFLV